VIRKYIIEPDEQNFCKKLQGGLQHYPSASQRRFVEPERRNFFSSARPRKKKDEH
jgi:hypothetical protein